MKRNYFYGVLLVVFIQVLLGSQWIYCQEDEGFMLEEITVTAEKRETSLQKAPLSITAVTGSDINQKGLVNFDDVLKDIPGVVVQAAARGFVVAIRGLGSDLPPGTGESSVSTNFDGIYNFRAESGTIGFYDLDRVEVLRGPQGTLYGRNATAGVVNVISRNPTDKFEGYGTVEIGSYDLLRIEGAVNTPVNDSVATRVAFVSINRDGYLSNGQNDALGSAARAKISYSPAEDVSAVVSAEYTKLGGKGNGFTSLDDFNSGNSYHNSNSENLSQDYKAYKISADVEFSAGPGVVTFIPGYQHAEGIVFSQNMGGDSIAKSWDPLDANQYSSELRYAARADSRVQWVAGLYYYKMKSERLGFFPVPTEVIADEAESYAAFGQIAYPVIDSVRIVIGVRAASDEKGYSNPAEPIPAGSADWSTFDWKAGVEADLAKAIFGYLTVATGHRPGGFNITDEGVDTFDQEELLSFEIGVKSRFLENRLQVNADVFYYDYNEFQYSDFFFSESLGRPISTLGNVPKARDIGAEVETQMLLGSGTILDMAVTYLKATYESDFLLHGGPLYEGDPVTEYALNMNGDQLPHAPEWTLKAGLEHTFSMGVYGSLTPRGDVRWSDDQYVAPYPGYNETQEAQAKYDVSVRYNPSDDKWSLNAYMKNASDELTKMGLFGTDVIVGSPRTVGFVFNAQF